MTSDGVRELTLEDKNEILDEIERNPELIDKLSYERLVKLNQLYDEKITELERLSLNVDINKK